MKEFDFDELDKAVTSLMGPGQDGNTSSDSSSDTVTTASPVSVQGVQTDAEPAKAAGTVSSSDATETVTNPQIIKKTVGAMPAKRSGRFMDVVHPSSDMTKTSMSTTPSREAKPVTPAVIVDQVAATEQPSIGDLMDAHLAEDKEQEEPSLAVGSDTLPQPDSLADLSSEDPVTSTEDESKSVQEPDKQEVEALVADSVASPFLADAKVEKRPLGSALPSTGITTQSAMPAPDTVDMAVTPEPLQAELNQDVLAIEADNSHEDSPKEEADSTPESTNDKPQEGIKSPQSPSALTPDHMLAASAAGASIAQQYKQQESTGDQHHEALYDTAVKDAQALAHPAKKKSGWLVVLWVVLLIALGVGGAVALYFLKVI